ncbi:MAG TPA: hypothetical protein PKW95_13470 [bacterium]|nr:hypothetical protein [bacterium]
MKRGWMILLMLLPALIFALAACDKNDDDDDNDAAVDDDTPADDDDDDDTTPADDDDDDDDTPPPLETGRFLLHMDFETDFRAHLRLVQYSDDTFTGQFLPKQSFDVITADVPLEGAGKMIRFPEALGRMIVLKFQGPAVSGGRCGDLPMSYSMALTAKEDNGYLVGGLTAYCGAETYYGRPARVMRLSGLQTLEE